MPDVPPPPTFEQGSVGHFDKWIFPVIENVAPTQADVIEQLVAVQPMQLPNAQVFYMDFVNDSWRFKLRKYRSYLHDKIENLLRRLRLRIANGACHVRRRIVSALDHSHKVTWPKRRHHPSRRASLLR